MKSELLIIFIILITVIDALYNSYFIQWKNMSVFFERTNDSYYKVSAEKFNKYFHRAGFIETALFFGFIVFLLFGAEIKAVQYILLAGLIRWLVFDITLNLLNRNKADYIGVGSDTDKILKSVKINQILLKLILITLNGCWIYFQRG